MREEIKTLQQPDALVVFKKHAKMSWDHEWVEDHGALNYTEFRKIYDPLHSLLKSKEEELKYCHSRMAEAYSEIRSKEARIKELEEAQEKIWNDALDHFGAYVLHGTRVNDSAVINVRDIECCKKPFKPRSDESLTPKPMNTTESDKQRVIKFRAWCAADEMMYYDIQEGIYFNDGSVYEFRRFLESDDYHRWTVMQFTGLLDKNGKEIYEGDVLRSTFSNEDDGYFKVIWNPNRARFQTVRFWLNNPGFTSVDAIDFETCRYLEVIGHIYSLPSTTKENKE